MKIRRSIARLVFACAFVAAPWCQVASAQAPPAPVTAGGREPTLSFGGLVQVQAEFGDQGDGRFANGNGRFYLRRSRINAVGRFLEEFDFKLELEATGTLANTSGLRAQLTDAYINWNRYHQANVKVGQFKTGFGFEQLYLDARLPSIERSLVNDRLTLNRQAGVQVAGDALDKRLAYSVGSFNGNGANNNFNDNKSFTWVGRISGQPWRGRLFSNDSVLSIGVNEYSTRDTALSLAGFNFDSTPATADRDGLLTGKRTGSGADLQFQVGPFELWVESLSATFKPTNRFPAPEFDSSGGYLQATYFVWDRRLQLLVKHETFDPSNKVRNNSTTTDTLGLNYFLKGQDLKLMVNYLRVDIDGKPTQDKFLARLQVIF